MGSKVLLWLMSGSLVVLACLLTRVSRYGPPHTNYDAAVYFDHAQLRTPSSKADIVRIVQSAAERGQKVRVVGSGHSWSSVAVSEDILLSLWNYTGVVGLDRDEMEVTVKAGTTLNQLNRYLNDRGLAMKNLGSISEQTVAGAISTGTHGNGMGFGNLATLVTGLEFVNGKGELVSARVGSNVNMFKAAQVSVGMLGVITEVTLSVEEIYLLREVLIRHTLDECLGQFDGIMRGGDHVKMWVELFSETCGVFAANRTSETRPRDNPNWTAKNMEVLVMEAILLISSWFPPSVPHVMRLIFLPSSVFSPYDRVDTPPAVLEVPHSLPVHWEAELALPFEGCPAAVRELRRIVIEHRIPANMPIEIRPVMGDDIWLSPNYGRLSCHVTLTLYNPSPRAAHDYFQKFYEATRTTLNLSPRPHWGKYVTNATRKDLSTLYPRLADFEKIRSEMDPRNIFINGALRDNFGF
jgi:L-gulonolactone oxidase